MIYRLYGKTGERVSLLGFGGMRFQDIENRDECVETMMVAARAGVNYFDTALRYFGGKSEMIFGEAFTEMKHQGFPFLCATKTTATSEKEIRSNLETQLKRMKLDKIDFYHVWCVTDLMDWKERKRKGVLQAFLRMKEEGLIRHVCLSSHLVEDEIEELLKEDVFEGVLLGYSAYNFSFRRKALEAITRRGLGCVVMNPLGGGLIPRHPERFDFVRTREDETVVDGALRFLFAHENIHVVLVGAENPQQMQEAVSSLEGYQPIPKEKIEEIKTHIDQSFEGLCTGCRYCEVCPEGIPVSKMVNAYNYKLLEDDEKAVLQRIQWDWNIPPQEAEKCVGCGACEEACTQHLMIMEILKDISQMRKRVRSLE